MQYPRSRLLFYLVDFTALLLITGILYAFRQSLWVEIHRAKVVFSNVKVNYGSSPKGWKFLEYSMSPCRIRGDGGLPGPNCIRLVRVEIAEDGGLDIRHESFLLASAPPYRALSYTWGPAEGRPEDADFVYRFMDKHNEQRSMPKNLVKALHRIRELDENKWYWIDFICIKQDHLRERGEQVSNMHNIYQQASAVDVWLGDASQDDVANVNRVLQDLVEHGRWEAKIRTGLPQNLSSPITISVIPQHILPEEDWDILIPFLSRRWFHRLWTLQEFSLAKRARVLYGKGFIDDTILAEAVSFLTNHSIPIEIQHGNHDAAGIAVHQRFLLKKHLLDVKLTAGFLPPFALNQGLPNYEALLALTYWHSTATTATDPRDYIYGITGIANVIMDRLLRDEVCRLRACPAYQPFKVDYTLTTAEVFKQFIVRLMHGSLGIRATTLMQKSVHNEKYDRPDHQRQRRAVASWEDSERELPSWVPNLANRRLSPLSIRNILEPYNQSARAPNVFGSPHLITQQFQILANDLHVFGHRIGRVEKHSSPFPSAYELAPCAEFGLDVIKVLNLLPEKYCDRNSTPIESLLASLGLGLWDSHAAAQDRIIPVPKDIERLLAHSLSVFVCIHMRDSAFNSVDEFLTKDTYRYFQSAQYIAGLDPDFLSAETKNWRDPARVFGWPDFIACLTQTNVLPNILCNCGHLATYFHRAMSQSAFVLSLDKQHHDTLCRQEQAEVGSSPMLIGVGPDSIQDGDEIWILKGSEWPFVLRPRYINQDQGTRKTEKPYHVRKYSWWRSRPQGLAVDVYELHGEAYVHGIMDGELFKGKEALDNLQEIVIR